MRLIIDNPNPVSTGAPTKGGAFRGLSVSVDCNPRECGRPEICDSCTVRFLCYSSRDEIHLPIKSNKLQTKIFEAAQENIGEIRQILNVTCPNRKVEKLCLTCILQEDPSVEPFTYKIEKKTIRKKKV